jgi:hypothetical protein
VAGAGAAAGCTGTQPDMMEPEIRVPPTRAPVLFKKSRRLSVIFFDAIRLLLLEI